MNKIAIIIIGGLLAAVTIAVFLTQKPKTTVSPVSKLQPSPTKAASAPAQLKTYTNASGFSFQYPQTFIVKEKKISNQSIYAWVELTHPQKKGVISIKLESSDLAKIDDWFTATKKSSIKGEIKKVKLADLEGREFTANNQIVTLALDEGGVLISIITNAEINNDFLLPAHQQIVSSFIFAQPPQTSTDTSGDGGENIIFEGEEVVE